MPIFATPADMRSSFEERDLIQLTDVDGMGAMDEARVERELASADAIIIGYVAARYKDAPALAGGTLLRDVACNLAFAALWKTDVPKWVDDRRRQAVETLTRIAAGTIKLDDGTEQSAPRPGAILTSGAPRGLTRESLREY